MRHAGVWTTWTWASVAAAAAIAGCAGPEAERPRVAAPARAREAAAVESPGAGVTPEKLDEINQFFYRKMGPIQFRCYNDEAERTHKKVQGHLSLSLVVQPGGKATDVKVNHSSLGSPSIEQCVVGEIKSWEWPDVPVPAPYAGEIEFKPAW